MATSGIEAELIDLLAVFIIAGGVGVFVAKYADVPYTIALLVAGLLLSVLGVEVGIQLTHDIILLVLLPPLLFEGAATTDLEAFRADAPVIVLLAVVGLVISIGVVGAAARYVLDFPVFVALLLASMVLPTDPVSVLALFEELGAPERLSVLVEGESLINDGVGVVIFTTLLGLATSDADPAVLTTPASLVDITGEILVTSVGGAVVGLLAGYVVYRVMVDLDEHMTEIVLTIILAYGSFLLAEHYVGVSGVVATVAAGLFMGNRGREYAMSAQTKISVFNTWSTAAFIVNTFIFVVIGAQTPIRRIVAFGDVLLLAVPIVLIGRGVAIYPLAALANRLFDANSISLDYQHVLVWGGLHASIPIALALGLPPGTPFREELRVVTFGVAAFSLVVQGLTVGRLIHRLGIVTTSDAEELYQLLVGRARAVDDVLDAADSLRTDNRIPPDLYERFTSEYEAEKEDLQRAIATLLDENPELERRERLDGERQLLKRERATIIDAEHEGLITTDVAEELLNEVNLKLERIEQGETTVLAGSDEEGYEEYWRERARDFGVLTADDD
jgi:CPA1 family monovalent cation:H+ antiporter